jgi:hypothetical protein
MAHSHRRQKQARHTARLGMAGGVLGVAPIAGGFVLVPAHGHRSEPTPHAMAARTTAATTPERPKAGTRLSTLGYAPPKTQNEDQYIPPGASHLVRVATDLPVSTGAGAQDLGRDPLRFHFLIGG